ncbi:M1 family peptidase [Bacillus salipaludis]|uniref:M1 family metallopeptidase n=1 Tax=Bacillus salipaludis TaxID=2547811 RepID=A0A4R5VJL3_9BACI|nr:M1 family metallopeptidase [Bacillus salipaludis]MDQ6596416.1 M1 family metallopeptidase [Bacillus salipaludis]TDK54657.1 M1 family peptidase [Bacillus salipaludis]
MWGDTIYNKKFVLILLPVIIVISFATWLLLKDIKQAESSKIEKTPKMQFSPKSVPPGSQSQYNIRLSMNQDGRLHLETTVKVKNVSKDSWDNLVFYFIPNMFTKNNSPQLEHPSIVQFDKVAVGGEKVDFKLDKDTLTIPLVSKLDSNKEVTVDFAYDLTLPENGYRFTKENGNYYLAQFYPMVATYRNHKWNKEEYTTHGETYHTAFSDFKVTYDIPNDYTIVSTSKNDKYPSENKGSFEVRNVKELFMAILKKPNVTEKKEGNVNIRVFGNQEDKDLNMDISETASDALTFFQKNIGSYPFKQLDIVLNQMGMEYPGIVTAGSIRNLGSVNPAGLKYMVVHEIAHQWFYGMISNDPYNEAWLDEGFADFAAKLYYFSKSKHDNPFSSIPIEQLNLPVNMPLDKYTSNASSYFYGKSEVMLWKLFEKRGGIKEAEKFLKCYYDFYKYKEVNTQEFVRFTKYYFNLKSNSVFKGWLLLMDS